MKLATIALASAFVLSTTLAFAGTSHHHHKYHRGYQGTVGMGYGQYGRSTVGTPAGGWTAPRSYGSPNNRGGLVGGSDVGTYRQ